MTRLEAFPFLPLFVPGDRPDRFEKAARSGADAVIVDLEDAVRAENKAAARDGLATALSGGLADECAFFVRLNAMETAFYESDLRTAAELPLSGVILSKAADPEAIASVREILGDIEIIALIETAQGMANARSIARVSTRLAFGSLDYAVAIGAGHVRHALEGARQELVLAAALAGQSGPLDGVTTSFKDAGAVQDDAGYAASLGFSGKLLIHPRQIEPSIRGFMPGEEETARAREILAAAGNGGAVAQEGAMIDPPVVKQAEAIVARAARGKDLES